MVGSWLDAESHTGDRVYNGFCCLRDSTQLSSGVSRSKCMSRIVLVRHGPSAHVAEARLLDRAALQQWRSAYDDAGIRPSELPPHALIAQAAAANHVIASDMRRAMESASRLAPGRSIQ